MEKDLSMDFAYDHNLVARILLTIITLGYSVPIAVADLNKTHATNPVWTGHARFHVVWQVVSYMGFSLIGLALLWVRGPFYIARLYLVCAVGCAIYGAFFLALLLMPMYGGRKFDENGYPPFPVRILGRNREWDVNVTVFTTILVFFILGIASISSGDSNNRQAGVTIQSVAGQVR
jgi:hypothetical protein